MPEQHLSAGGTERYDEAAQPEEPPGQAPPGEEEGAEAAGSAASAEEPAGEPDDGPRPLGVGVRPTGHGPVDAQLRRLEDADHLAVSGHLEVYEDVHRGLRESLAALDRPHTPRS
ncbi:hypothetical protein ITI46_20325 [Streptomyces oryzae]|uniref:Uncharacterized protein n=1 Tax=Streptomyces oryzae TaxID=1434886 RepID=A0ABS3XF30_9ACTN|nr:hypothetical protein [Streptomyces oryzae]